MRVEKHSRKTQIKIGTSTHIEQTHSTKKIWKKRENLFRLVQYDRHEQFDLHFPSSVSYLYISRQFWLSLSNFCFLFYQFLSKRMINHQQWQRSPKKIKLDFEKQLFFWSCTGQITKEDISSLMLAICRLFDLLDRR